MFPLTITSPSSGVYTLEIILSNVLFPAPLKPMIPTFSPLYILKDTLSVALKMVFFSLVLFRVRITYSFMLSILSLPILKLNETFLNSIAILSSPITSNWF